MPEETELFGQDEDTTTAAQYMDSYRIQVHAMKSLAATVGILPLFGVAKILEYAAKDGNTDVMIAMTPAFLTEWRSYQDKLQGVFGIEADTGACRNAAAKYAGDGYRSGGRADDPAEIL